MITTIDGVEKKPGDVCWEIAHSQSGYYPNRFIVSPLDNNSESVVFYHYRDLCAEQCNLMNQDK